MFEPSMGWASAVVALGVCALHTRRTRGTIQRLERETEELKVENAAEKARREAAEAKAAAEGGAGREVDTRADTKMAASFVLLLLFLLLIILLQVLPISMSTEAVAAAAVVVVAAEEGARREEGAKAAAEEVARREAEAKAAAQERARRVAEDRAEAAERAQRAAEAALAAKGAEHAAVLEALNGATRSEAVEDLRRFCGSWSSTTQQTKKDKEQLMEQLTGRRNGLSGDRPSMEVVNDDGENGHLVHE